MSLFTVIITVKFLLQRYPVEELSIGDGGQVRQGFSTIIQSSSFNIHERFCEIQREENGHFFFKLAYKYSFLPPKKSTRERQG
jgi:hypothetical protein